jgi:hypothetical protein
MSSHRKSEGRRRARDNVHRCALPMVLHAVQLLRSFYQPETVYRHHRMISKNAKYTKTKEETRLLHNLRRSLSNQGSLFGWREKSSMCSANMYIPRYSPKKSSFLSMYSLDSI